MSIPSGGDPEFREPPGAKKAAPRHRQSLANYLWLLALLVAVIALLLPTLRLGSRPMARRAQCMNNLREIVIALYAYASEQHALPPAYTTDANGRPLHSWRTLILPYLGQSALYESIDLSKPWDDPANARAFNTALKVYHCPELGGRPSNKTAYQASVGPHSFLLPTEPRPLATITDDRKTTLALIEVGEPNAAPWMAPVDADEAMILSLGPDSKLVHPGGFHMATADQSVIFASPDLPPEVRRAINAVDGGEAVSRDQIIR